jgi:hypothetical protein
VAQATAGDVINHHAVAGLEAFHSGADALDLAAWLVSGDNTLIGFRPAALLNRAINCAQIAAAQT